MEQLNFADYAIILVSLGCIALGIYKGFRRCTISLTVWVIAIILAYLFGKSAGKFFTFITSPGLQQIIGTVILVVVFGLLGILIRSLILPSYKSGTVSRIDRFLGVIFGLFFATFLIVSYLISAGSSVTEKDWYQKSVLLPYFIAASETVKESIPKSWQDKFLKDIAAMESAGHATATDN